ncbi:MBL fold metallo-hydrolase [Microbacterium halophytorum]|uniref:MBL fold metallo-hydrolase n=1 Tax=Microbacterium halophytorum TaxID=2067568 RepID=UPI000CFDDAAE|nr:MBL fold metallo-hydrolase [Microbacterium halophytorum]
MTDNRRFSRRGMLLGGMAVPLGAGVLAAAGPASGAAAKPGNGKGSKHTTGLLSGVRTQIVPLGVAGGPTYLGDHTAGTSTMIVHAGRAYIVDLGLGAFANLAASGIAPNPQVGSSLTNVAAVLFTHLHSDHTTDWPAMYATGGTNIVGRDDTPIQVFGPGDRGTLPRLSPPDAPERDLAAEDNPVPGLVSMSRSLEAAFAQDINDRVQDSNFPLPSKTFDVHDIDLTGIWDIGPDGVPPRLDAPIPVWRDGDVTVTATLVDHHPTAPAFAYRFDTPDGSIVISGDTTVSENLIDLARGADVLIHEVIDPAWVDQLVANLPPETAEPLRKHLLESHTTIAQVGREVAQPAGVKTLVLNHRVPVSTPDSHWRAARKGFDGKLVVAHDLEAIAVGV